MVCGRAMWQVELPKNISSTVISKYMETITSRFLFFLLWSCLGCFVLSSLRQFKDKIETQASSRITLHLKGGDNYKKEKKNAIKGSVWASPRSRWNPLTHFNPHLHTKTKRKKNSINFWGIYILASVRTKVVHFRKKIRDHEKKRETTVKTEEQSLTPRLWRRK